MGSTVCHCSDNDGSVLECGGLTPLWLTPARPVVGLRKSKERVVVRENVPDGTSTNNQTRQDLSKIKCLSVEVLVWVHPPVRSIPCHGRPFFGPEARSFT